MSDGVVWWKWMLCMWFLLNKNLIFLCFDFFGIKWKLVLGWEYIMKNFCDILKVVVVICLMILI